MDYFQPKGNLASFAADVTAPTGVQSLVTSNEPAPQYVLSNTSTTVAVTVGWGDNSDQAKLNAAAGTKVQNCYYLMPGSQVVVSAQPDAYFSGIAASAVTVKVQAGIGG